MKKPLKKINIVVRCLMLLLYLGIYSSITMFYHVHLVNGFVLSHSHPYKHDKNKKTPYGSHSHSSSEYKFIQQLNETSWKDTAALVEISSPVIFYFEPLFFYNTPFIKVSDYYFGQLRAPPAIC